MKKTLLFSMVLTIATAAFAQEPSSKDTSWKKTPRYTPSRINDLVHTKLDVRFDYEHAHVLGKAWITLTPHFNPTDSLTLDAKGMDIKSVSLIINQQTPSALFYNYDGLKLRITLPKSYKRTEKYTVYIEYVANPNEYEEKSGLDPMLGAKGIFFINPKGETKNKPTQIWTQGETESSSVWFPTIDQTQQKCTEEILMTVPAKYVTLSNGKLVSQKINTDGTRTDYWKMDQPHSPYLFFMGVGDYAVIKDSWRGKEVNYYVEKEFAGVARKIFGNTPEMMTYFSKLTGVDFPWVKYSQITGRDYVAGAMENTTATIHQETAQQDARELTDENIWEGTIAHELFHQWFGDYVTAESWSNLTLNESFADYSQTLWAQYKYGKDAGDAENLKGMQGYLMGDNSKKDLVRFFYEDRENMFDGVSYQKGGRILHMLRNYLGDSVFFKGLNLYLTTNKYKAAEAHHLRLALEEISGQDLTWYFNQWYYGNGHPKLDIQYTYNDSSKTCTVVVKQIQNTGKIFRIPTYIDIYEQGSKKRNQVWLEHAIDTFQFKSNSKPQLINFDGDKVLLCEKKENKTLEEYIYQYHHAGTYLDRHEAVEFCGKKTDNNLALSLLKDALKDPFYGIREMALTKIDTKKDRIRKYFESDLISIASHETYRPAKGFALALLGNFKSDVYKDLYLKNVYDSSYSVSGYALESLNMIDSAKATQIAIALSKQPAKGRLDIAINTILAASGNEEVFDKMADRFENMPLTNEKFTILQQIATMVPNMKNEIRIKKGIDLIIGFRDAIPAAYKAQTDPYINGMILNGLISKFKSLNKTDISKYIEGKK